MTCIAWDGTTLAADKRVIDEFYNTTTITKIAKVDSVMIGVAGNINQCVQILESFKNNPLTFWKDLVIPDPDFKFLLIDKTGELYEVHNSMVLVRIEDKHAAIGCGRDYAMAIMHAGGTSEQACHIASRLNAACGAELDTLSFVEKAEKDSATVAVKPFNRATKKGK